eukprot:gene44408-54307_t
MFGFGTSSVFNGFRSLCREKVTGAFAFCQQAAFSKYISNSRTKRLPLTTKRAGKGYYKGNRSRKEGKLNSKGQFIMDKEKCTELVVPDLSGFSLKPYVGYGAKRNVRDVNVQL